MFAELGAKAAPPVLGGREDCAWAAAGSTAASDNVRARARKQFKTRFLFRRPAGLADGLALKEPAPHALMA
jgi:hypothetical protein